jgi:hypothetical protein
MSDFKWEFNAHLSPRAMKWITFLFCAAVLIISGYFNTAQMITDHKPLWLFVLVDGLDAVMIAFLATLIWPKEWNRLVVWVTQPIWNLQRRLRADREEVDDA